MDITAGISTEVRIKMSGKKTTKNSREARMMSEEIKKKNEEIMRQPINRILNAVKEDGKTLKYEIAQRLRPYMILNPDPVLNSMRLSNALLHEIRWRKKEATKYLLSYESKVDIPLYDKHDKEMSKDDIYLAYISQNQNVHIALSKLRDHLVTNLLSKVDDELFTMDMYQDFVLKTEKIIKELGFELFPTKIDIIEPL